MNGAGYILRLALATFFSLMSCLASAGNSHAITQEEWLAYKEKFLDQTGRIIDNANGGISHSEGQGYGLLLSYLANNRGDFDRIWAFTRTEMLLRDDGLSVWKWDPRAKPHVEDSNNATDGDLLIAYAAALAGRAWNRPDLTEAARSIAQGLLDDGVDGVGSLVLLKPGSVGFGRGERADGPVVNPSYWVFEALPVLAELAPDPKWQKLADDGRTLVAMAMKIGKANLPPDWVSLKGLPTTADGFPQQFSYNAVRIPLYMLRAGNRDAELLRTMATNMSDSSGKVRLVDIATGQTRELLGDAGYRIIPALVRCVLDGAPLPKDVRRFAVTDYYPSTLHLLALSYARRLHMECL